MNKLVARSLSGCRVQGFSSCGLNHKKVIRARKAAFPCAPSAVNIPVVAVFFEIGAGCFCALFLKLIVDKANNS